MLLPPKQMSQSLLHANMKYPRNVTPVYIILPDYVMSHCEGNGSNLHGTVALQGTIVSPYVKDNEQFSVCSNPFPQ